MNYKNMFTRILREDLGAGGPSAPIKDAGPSDEQAWNDANPEIVGNGELSGQFSVEGMPADITEEYVKKIQAWRSGIDEVSGKMEEIYTFASDKANKPGAGEIFSSIGGNVEKLLTDLGTLNGQLRSLGNKIKVAIQTEKDKEKRR